MTTSVIVDAHSGWPVKVEAIDIGAEPVEIAIVQPGEKQEFPVWQERRLLITEMKKAEEGERA